jgi:hypothetical protein
MAAFFVPALPPVVSAQTVCAPHDKAVAQLGQTHGETVANMGLQNNGNVLQVLVSRSGSWTILVTMPSGVSCLAASGTAWEKVRAKQKGPAT